MSCKPLGYELRGWSRTPKAIDGVEGFAGDEEFDAFLSGTDILVNLLPLTPETEGILNYETFGKLRRGPCSGGPVDRQCGARRAPARGRYRRGAGATARWARASLDVFEIEPLPADEPALGRWRTATSRPISRRSATSGPGVKYFAHVIREHEAGKPLPNVVDRSRGY